MRQVLQLHSIGRGMLEPGGCEKIHTELPEMQITVSEIKWPQLSKSWHFWHSYFFPSCVQHLYVQNHYHIYSHINTEPS